MAREDQLVDDLRSIFDEARRSSGQVQAETLLAAAPIVLKGTSPGRREVGYMRDQLTRESYQAICRAIGEELDRLNGEIVRLKKVEKIAGLVEKTRQRLTDWPVAAARPVLAAKPPLTTKPPLTAKPVLAAKAAGPDMPVRAGKPAEAAPAPGPAE